MKLTFGDLIQTSEERVVLSGDQVSEFVEILKQAPMSQVERDVVLASLKDAIKVIGYRYRGIGNRHPGKMIGQFAGRLWFAEAKERPRIDWGGAEHGLNIQQMQFARMIQHSVAAEFQGSGSTYVDLDGHTVQPEALARFEYALVTALHAYDTARTERLNFLEGEYRKLLDIDVGDYVVQVPAGAAVGDPIGDREPIFPFSALAVHGQPYAVGDPIGDRAPIHILGVEESKPVSKEDWERLNSHVAKVEADDLLRKASGMTDDELRAAGYTIGDMPGERKTCILVDRERDLSEAAVQVRIDEHGITVTERDEPLDYAGV
jgi:hypothetical protein